MVTVSDDEISYVGNDCSDTNVNAYYLGVHAISKKEYDILKGNFYGDENVDEKQYSPDHIDTKICAGKKIAFDTGTNPTTNNNITLEIVDEKLLQGNYSMHFFKAIIYFFGPFEFGDSYEFTQAFAIREGKVIKTLAMRVIKANVPVYHGDLTNMYP
jgi:hypothetical protein